MDHAAIKTILEPILQRTLPETTDTGIADIQKLHGDASNREYFRATLQNGTTLIVMQLPKGRASVSEEITNFSGPLPELPFVAIGRYLQERGIPVPAIMAVEKAHDILLLEDLGNTMLGNRIMDEPSERGNWYRKAIDFLVALQTKTRQHFHPIVSRRSFDATLLNWEFDHFREYLVEARIGRPMPAKDRELFEKITREITHAILNQPYGFTHRDFQSRNIMLKDGELYLIDFQDALRGPLLYDLVSLLRDSYIELAPSECAELIHYYAETQKPHGIYSENVDIVKLMTHFHHITLQRKMKDAGRFVYIDRVKKNQNFLKFIPTSLNYVRHAFSQLPAYDKLFTLLKPYVPEFN